MANCKGRPHGDRPSQVMTHHAVMNNDGKMKLNIGVVTLKLLRRAQEYQGVALVHEDFLGSPLIAFFLQGIVWVAKGSNGHHQFQTCADSGRGSMFGP